MVSRILDGSDCVSGHYTVSGKDIIIVVLGVTGSGRSNFICKVFGIPEKFVVGHSLGAHTSKVVVYTKPLTTDRNLVLVDTPGFDDISKVQVIAQWLASSYKSGARIQGLLFLHRITDNRMPSSTIRLLSLLRQLCGEESLHCVSLVTTMWDCGPKPIAEAKEAELVEKYWQPLVGSGSPKHRFDNTTNTAHCIIETLFTKPTIVLSIQRELIDEKKRLDDTALGAGLGAELAIQERRGNASNVKALHQESRTQRKILYLLGGLLGTSVAGIAWLIRENRSSIVELSLQLKEELAALKVSEHPQETATSAWLSSSISTLVSVASAVMSSVSGSTLSPTLTSAASLYWKCMIPSIGFSELSEDMFVLIMHFITVLLFGFLVLREWRALH